MQAPIVGEFLTLNVTIAPEIPKFYGGGSWGSAHLVGTSNPWSGSFNETIPTINGTASNMIYPQPGIELSSRLTRQYTADAALIGVIRGCHGTCKAKLIAPALAATCDARQIPVNYTILYSNDDFVKMMNGQFAPPLEHEAFVISTNLVEDVTETLNLVTGSSMSKDCVGVFSYKVCTLASAVGEYDVTVNGNKATLDDPGHPRILALANNTPAAQHITPGVGAHRSTLSTLAWVSWFQWFSTLSMFNLEQHYQDIQTGHGVDEGYRINVDAMCPSYLDPYEDVITALNKMMVYVGAFAAQEDASYLETHMDPGWPVNTTTIGTVTGYHNVFESDFRFFIAAALVEIACILLVAPTYWGVSKLMGKRVT